MPIPKIQSGVAVVAGVLLLAAALRSQMPAVGPVWEYSSVTASVALPGHVTICYASAGGCRTEQVGVNNRQVDDALMMAATRLGQKGWEMTTATDVMDDAKSERILYFRRVQSVLNRGD